MASRLPMKVLSPSGGSGPANPFLAIGDNIWLFDAESQPAIGASTTGWTDEGANGLDVAGDAFDVADIGNGNKCVDFEGTPASLTWTSIIDPPSISPTNNWMVGLAGRFSAATGAEWWYYGDPNGGNLRFNRALSSGGARNMVTDGRDGSGSPCFTNNFVLSADTWYSLIFYYDTTLTAPSFFINGVQSPTLGGPLGSTDLLGGPGRKLYIGRSGVNPGGKQAVNVATQNVTLADVPTLHALLAARIA